MSASGSLNLGASPTDGSTDLATGLKTAAGVAAVYTPKDFELNRIMADIVRIVDGSASEAA